MTAAIPTANPKSKSQHAYEWLRERIQRAEFGPGHRLVLRVIADELGMSVVPVREAVRRLEADKYVEFEPNVGARVAVMDDQAYADAMQTLGIVEGAATALAAPFITAADLAAAAEINQQMQALLDEFDPYAFTRLNHAFHRSLFSRCPNGMLLDAVERSWSQIARVRVSTFAVIPARARESIAEHETLLALVRRGAAFADIEQSARRHRWRTMRAYFQRHSAPAQPVPPA